jgi:hypothetical protein
VVRETPFTPVKSFGTNSGSLAMLLAILLASLRVSNLAAERRSGPSRQSPIARGWAAGDRRNL